MNHFYPTKYYKGYFILLEEDHFVVEDILYMSEFISKNVWRYVLNIITSEYIYII